MHENSFRKAIMPDYINYEEDEHDNLLLNHIVALANSKGGKVLIRYFPDNLLTFVDNIRELIQKHIYCRKTESPDVLESIEIGRLDSYRALVIKIDQGHKRPYKKYRDISDNEGQKKIYIRQFNQAISGYESSIVIRDKYRKLKQGMKFNEEYLNKIYDDVPTDIAKFPLLDDYAETVKHLDYDHLKIKDVVSNIENIANYLKNHAWIKSKDKNIVIKDNLVRIKGPIRLHFLAIYIYLKEFAPKFLPQDKASILNEVILNLIAHRDYSIPRPIEIDRTKNSLVLTSPGGLHPDTNFDDLMESGQINKSRRNDILYNYSKETKTKSNNNCSLIDVIEYYNGRDDVEFKIRETINSVMYTFYSEEHLIISDDPYENKRTRVLNMLFQEGECSRDEINRIMNLNMTASNLKKTYLGPLLDQKFIEFTLPDKPTSRHQKYRITEKGQRELLRKV